MCSKHEVSRQRARRGRSSCTGVRLWSDADPEAGGNQRHRCFTDMVMNHTIVGKGRAREGEAGHRGSHPPVGGADRLGRLLFVTQTIIRTQNSIAQRKPSVDRACKCSTDAAFTSSAVSGSELTSFQSFCHLLYFFPHLISTKKTGNS